MPKLSHFRNAFRYFFTILFFFYSANATAQTLGGATAYNFLKLSPSPIVTAAGGVNISYAGADAGPSFGNPSLLSPSFHSQLNVDFTSLSGGVKAFHLSDVYFHKKWNTTFSGGIFFVDYGSIKETDAAGNVYGTFKAADYAIQISAARTYLEKWRYGATLKWINSSYGIFHSMAAALDVGILYADTSKKLRLSVVAKNMGYPIKNFSGHNEELPFDLQLGLTKKLAKAPFGFSITAHHIHQFNLLYRDTVFNVANNLSNKNSVFTKAANHFVFATHIYIGANLEGIIGYNQLRNSELSLSTGSGLTGFSAGLAATFRKLHFAFAHAAYQKGIGYNQLGITLLLNSLVGLGQ